MDSDVQIQKTLKTREVLNQEILDYCMSIAGSMKVTAISIFDNCLTESPESRGTIEVIMVIRDFQPRLMTYVKALNGRNAVVFAVDQWVFERDIERGFLGEASVGTLVFPHKVLAGNDYLCEQEILLKKRLILELLENLVVSFPELAARMRIKPQYFMYEAIMARIRVFPPLAFCAQALLRELEKKPETLSPYCEALKQLETERKVVLFDNYVMIPKKFISKNIHRVRLTNLSKNAPRRVFTSLFEFFPQLLNFFSKSTEKGLKLQRISPKGKNAEVRPLVDPQKYLFIPTANGFVSLADRWGVEDFARKILLNNEKGHILVKPVGGVLNDVYVVEATSSGTKKRVLVKRFKEWSGIKWFPLSVWALGARTFAVSGRSRLERECAISELLRRQGFDVPRILHVNLSQRLVFMEYIEGENLVSGIKRIALSEKNIELKKEFEAVTKVGEKIAQVHALKVALGDTKPENVIMNTTDRIYLLDFEQASTAGDKAWDVAEFLYYSGHFLSPLKAGYNAKLIAEAFIAGYLRAGGDPAVINKASKPKYTRVFSIFTLPSVILAISKACKNVNKIE